MAKRHLNCKYGEFVRTIQEFCLGKTQLVLLNNSLKFSRHLLLQRPKQLQSAVMLYHARGPWNDNNGGCPACSLTLAPSFPGNSLQQQEIFVFVLAAGSQVGQVSLKKPTHLKGTPHTKFMLYFFHFPLPGTIAQLTCLLFGVCYFCIWLLRDIILYAIGV